MNGRSPQGDGVVAAVKIYGERNSGTNYLSQLVALNFSVRVLSGVAELPLFARAAAKMLKRVSASRASEYLEGRRDRYFEARFDETLGWKHTCVPVERVARVANDRVGFLAIFKNPYAWALSLHRRPYHGDKVKRAFLEFLDTPYPMRGRDGVEEKRLKPLELWNRKTQSYFDLADEAPRTGLFRYEEFLENENAALKRIAELFGFKAPEEVRNVDGSTKADEMTHADYRRYYLEKSWRQKLEDDHIRAINAQLDHALVERCGYAVEAS